MKAFILHISRKLWYALAILMVLAALAITLARLLTPLLNDHRAAFEAWASHLLKTPVKIEQLQASWQGLYPDIKLQKVTVLSQDQKQVLFNFESLQIDIDVWRSLLSHQLQPANIEISGVGVHIHQLDHKNFQISELQTRLGVQKQRFEGLPFQDVIAWLFSRPRLTLRNIKIQWQYQNQPPIPITLTQIRLTNQDAMHQLSGQILWDQLDHSAIQFVISLTGKAKQLVASDVQGYIDLRHVNLLHSLQKQKFYGYQILDGVINGQFWVHWQNGHFQSVHSLWQANQLVLSSSKTQQPFLIKHFSGNGLWQAEEDGWRFSADHLKLTVNQKEWPENRFQLRVKTMDNHIISQQLNIHYLDIADVATFFSFSEALPQPFQQVLQGLKPVGELQDLSVAHQGNIQVLDQYHITTKFQQLGFNHFQKIPGVRHLSGVLNIEPKKGSMDIDADRVFLDFGKLFSRVLYADQLSGRVDWQKREDHAWVVTSHHVTASNQQVAVNGKVGLLFLPNDHDPIVSLLAGFHLNDPTVVKNYLPISILKKPVVNWLNQAFIGGEGAFGTVLLRGPIFRFPFDREEGTFVVDANVHDLDLHYANNWPDAHHINAKLIFKNRSMVCKAQSGQIYETKFKTLNAEIPYMGRKKPAILKLDGVAACDASDILKYLKNSPLRRRFGENLSSLHMQGDSKLNIQLMLPLHNLKQAKVNGSILFADGIIQMPNWKFMVDALRGKLLFTEKDLSSENLKANLLGYAADVALHTVRNKKQKPFTEINFGSQMSVDDLIKHFHWPRTNYISGKTNYHAILKLYTVPASQKQSTLAINSNLKGIKIDLPKPFYKSDFDSVDTSLTFGLTREKFSKSMLQYGHRFTVALLYHWVENKRALFSAHLRFGEKYAAFQSEPGWTVTGFLPRVKWVDWKPYFLSDKKTAAMHSAQSLSAMLKTYLREIDLRIGEFYLLNQRLVDAGLRIKPDEDRWSIGINSVSVLGYLLLPSDLNSEKTIEGNFKKLTWVSQKPVHSSVQKPLFNPSHVPALDIHANDFYYNDQPFGVMDLKTHALQNALSLDRLDLKSPLLTCQLQGKWALNNADFYSSEITGKASSNNISQLFQAWNFNSSLVATTGEATFDLNWLGAIYRTSLATMKGNIAINFGKGWLIDLGNDTDAKLNMGRLLSLLSIHRLLVMNFEDLTHPGYGFDEMKGNFLLRAGKITTRDLYFDGSVAKIDVMGDIDLMRKMLDLNLVITPYLTSSLPIVATIAGGPVVGAVTWVVEKIVGKAVDQFTTYYYHVTGDWRHPVIKRH